MKWKITLLLLCVLFAALIVKIWPEFYTVWMLNYRERVADQMGETNKVNLETGVVRVSLGRHKFNIPLRYMYWEAYKKRGYWPKVKPERVEVGAISISVLLPDFKPYYEEDDDEWNVLGHGKRLEILVQERMKRKQDWYEFIRNRVRSRAIRVRNIFGLEQYDDKNWDRYFPIDENLKLLVNCYKDDLVSSPGCDVRSEYESDLVIEYSHGSRFLYMWKEIDEGIKRMLREFEERAISEGVAKEE